MAAAGDAPGADQARPQEPVVKPSWAALRAPWAQMLGVVLVELPLDGVHSKPEQARVSRVLEGDAVPIVERTQHRRWAHAAATLWARGFAAPGRVAPPPQWHRIPFVGDALPGTADPRARPRGSFTTGS